MPGDPGAGRPRVEFHTSRGHIRVDVDGQCALTATHLGPELAIWQTTGLRLDPVQVREYARLLIEWSDNA